jgi:hypothetical protein
MAGACGRGSCLLHGRWEAKREEGAGVLIFSGTPPVTQLPPKHI